MVIAVPVAFAVQRHYKQVGMFKLFQRLPPRRRAILQQRVAQRSAHALKDGCVQQESLDVLALLLQHFLNQVVQHETVATGKGRYETAGICAALH